MKQIGVDIANNLSVATLKPAFDSIMAKVLEEKGIIKSIMFQETYQIEQKANLYRIDVFYEVTNGAR